jgi:hypothetical protein
MSGRCAEVRDLIHPFLDGELEVDRNVDLLKHFELCVPCRERCDAERALQESIKRAGEERLDEVTKARVLNGAFARLDADLASPRSRSVLRLVAVAAGLLLAATVGLFGYMDPMCWFGGCNTQFQIKQAFAAAEVGTVQTMLPAGVEPLRSCTDVSEGDCILACSPGLPSRLIRELICKKTGKRMRLLQIPDGHLHGWELTDHKDGRRYLQKTLANGAEMVAWQNGAGVSVCVGRDELPAESLYVMAASVRDSGV